MICILYHDTNMVILIIKIKAQHSALSKAIKTQNLNRKIY